MKEMEVVRILLAFGADVNQLNSSQKTPLDFCLGQYMFMHRQDSFVEISIDKSTRKTKFGEQKDELVEFLKACGGVHGKDIISYSVKREEREVCHRLCLQRDEKGFKDKEKCEFVCPVMADWCRSKAEMYHKYWSHISKYPAPFSSDDLSKAADFGIQVKNMRLLQMAGSRVLVLDGGGMKGLVEIEMLDQIEKATKANIVDLFDWIVGTSTGAVIALALVYARLSLSKLRKLFYKMKDPVFGSTIGLAYSTSSLTEVLQSTFKDMTMSHRTYPRLIVTAVNKTNPNNLKLEFFGNHPDLDPKYGERLVWKVARYSSAAPVFFKELDNYVDGGVLANNPSSAALTVIQGMYSKQKIKIPISMVVSLGSGVMPEDELDKEDAKEYILFGRIRRIIDKASNLVTLLGNAITESEQVATDMSSRCKEQGINYFRCSPHLSHLVGAGETDRDILIDAVLDAKRCTHNKRILGTLMLWFDACWSANRDLLRSGLL